MKILALDFETTGLLHEKEAFITEIGAALFSSYTGRVLESFGAVLQVPPGQHIPPHIVHLTKLNIHDCDNGMDRPQAFETLVGMIAKADAILTKNGVMFDIPMMLRDPLFQLCYGEFAKLPPVIDLNWDIPLPPSVKGRSQNHIACDLGFLNPFPHQALPDCLTLIEICRRIVTNWEKALESASSPIVEVEAVVKYQDKDKAKSAGFTWDKDRSGWFKVMRQAQTAVQDWRFSYTMKAIS